MTVLRLGCSGFPGSEVLRLQSRVSIRMYQYVELGFRGSGFPVSEVLRPLGLKVSNSTLAQWLEHCKGVHSQEGIGSILTSAACFYGKPCVQSINNRMGETDGELGVKLALCSIGMVAVQASLRLKCFMIRSA